MKSVSAELAEIHTCAHSSGHFDWSAERRCRKRQHLAQGVLEAIAELSWINKAHYLNYVTANMEENMTSAEREIEAGTFAALATGLTALDHPSPWDRLHRSWLSRHYFRIEPGVGSPSQ